MDQMHSDRLAEVGISLDADSSRSLADTAKWAKFISITVFIMAGFILISGLLGGAMLLPLLQRYNQNFGMFNNATGAIIIVAVIIIVGILVTVYYFLFNFAAKVKKAMLMQSTESLTAGIASMKTFIIITTVFTILSLLLSLIKLF